MVDYDQKESKEKEREYFINKFLETRQMASEKVNP